MHEKVGRVRLLTEGCDGNVRETAVHVDAPPVHARNIAALANKFPAGLRFGINPNSDVGSLGIRQNGNHPLGELKVVLIGGQNY